MRYRKAGHRTPEAAVAPQPRQSLPPSGKTGFIMEAVPYFFTRYWLHSEVCNIACLKI
jgi:hypothetical protein